MGWWTDRQADWTSGAPGRVVETLALAYDQVELIERVAGGVGIVLDAAVSDAAPDAAWVAVMTRAVEGGVALDLVADVLADRRADVFWTPLQQQLGDGVAAAYAAVARRHGIDYVPEDYVKSALAGMLEGAAVEPGELQAVVTPGSMIDTASGMTALSDVIRRTARIEVDGVARGTGVLVGEDLLLTAAHVFNPRAFPPFPPDRLPVAVARFDYSSGRGRSPAETGVTVAVSEYLAGSLPTPGETAGRASDWNADEQHLDYALVRLKQVPPGERGWYSIDTMDYVPGGTQVLVITQHPRGRYQEWSFITESERNGNGTRIRYAGGTERGSSGSPIVDLYGRLVAIHHYFDQSLNQGVPVGKIFAELIAKGYTSAQAPAGAAPVAAAVVSIDPFNARDLQGSAFVNRGILRGHLKEMAEKPQKGRPTLVITGNSGTGVSYSYWLASHVAATATLYQPLVDAAKGGMKVFPIDLRKYANADVEARREEIIEELYVGFEILTAEQLLETTDRHAQRVRSLTTVERTIRAKLMSSDRQWWVFFDNIDNAVAAQQGDVRELIGTLLGIARDPQYRLRVVLAGREAHLVERAGVPAHGDEAGGLPRAEVDRWLRAGIDAADCHVDETLLAEKLDQLYPDGQDGTASAIGPELPIVLEQLIEAAPNGT